MKCRSTTRWGKGALASGGCLGAALLSACAGAPSADVGWSQPSNTGAPPKYEDYSYSSLYLTMRDGEKIAIDLYLPQPLRSDTRLPTILHQTRYYRSVKLRLPFRLIKGAAFDHRGIVAKRRSHFLPRGYAWIDVDVRGSGASTGARVCPWSPDEVQDGAEIVNWILRQPWSNGKVGALGSSYDGTAAEMLLVNQHPAVRAVAPQFSIFDAYADLGFPGGIRASWFLREWGRANHALDTNRPEDYAGFGALLMVNTVQPVDADVDGSVLALAVQDHQRNYNVATESTQIVFRDDVVASDPYLSPDRPAKPLPVERTQIQGSIGLFSPHSYRSPIEASGAAIYSYAGWLEGAFARAAIKRFLTVRNPGRRLLLGPWNHGGRLNVSPASGPQDTGFDHDEELLRFFDHYLLDKETGIETEQPVHYFTMVEEKWKSAPNWPPPGTHRRRLYLAKGHQLSFHPPDDDAAEDRYRVDPTAQTGDRSRWKGIINFRSPVEYPDRAEQDAKLLVYSSPPLEEAMEVTGHPVLTLHVRSTATDGYFFAYLEDVSPSGRVTYVTEGMLRAIHRRERDTPRSDGLPIPHHTYLRADAWSLVPGEVATIRFDLLPTSYCFRAGHAIRIAIAGADQNVFAGLPQEPPTWHVQRSAAHPSSVELPVMPQ